MFQIPEIADTPNFIEELEKDKRFHPSIIGIILFIFLCSVASFISYMESMTYFDAFYACFITYSTIGFGDIDIYVSYKTFFNTFLIAKFTLFSREFHIGPIGST